MHGTPVEGNIEDSASNLPRVAERLNRAAKNVIDLYSMEMLHSTQAIDLRKLKQPNVKLAEKTQALYDAYRKEVPFVEKDRNLTSEPLPVLISIASEGLGRARRKRTRPSRVP